MNTSQYFMQNNNKLIDKVGFQLVTNALHHHTFVEYTF